MKITVARVASLASYVALALWVMAWMLVLSDLDARYVSLYLLLFVGPLLIPLRGILATRDKAMVWGTLLVLPYAVHGGVMAWAGGDKAWLGIVEAGLALSYLFSASFFIRWRAQARSSS
jgi:uncharacterized membrane protein